MKKILLLIVACLSFGVLFAQEIPKLKYFKTDGITEYAGVVDLELRPPFFPKLTGPSGAYEPTPENHSGFRLFRIYIKNLLETYCRENDWYPPEKEWLRKYKIKYSFYFDKKMNIFAYKIFVHPAVFTKISEERLKDIGDYCMKRLDYRPYFRIVEGKEDSFSWADVGFSLNILYIPIP
jgi:hypothetical protein